MLFNSLEFLVFGSIVLAAYYALGRLRRGHVLQNLLLLLASYWFYAQWDWRFLSLIWVSTAVDYVVGRKLATTEAMGLRKRLLAISVVCNLGLLGVFKYYGFFVESFADLMIYVGVGVHIPSLNIILPVGISFYTFQTMSYTIDIYRGKLQPTANPLEFALFVAFFPQLVAGPIERARSLIPQITGARTFCRRQFMEGLHLSLWGMYKKVFIADVLAHHVDVLFSSQGGYTGLDVWLGLYLFAFQIYADFSGYTDIARGISKMMGFDLMLNFNLPYIATNPSDFWRRWHISLSSWLKEYLYFSLGGNRAGTAKTYRNLVLTMLLGGLWHGAAWTFVIWGAFHGAILVVHHWYRSMRSVAEECSWTFNRIVAIAFMFHVTCIGWLIFRAQSVGQIGEFLFLMFSSLSSSGHTVEMASALISATWLLLLVQVMQAKTGDLLVVTKCHWFLRLNFYLFVLMGIVEKFGATANEFIYFQF